MKRRPLGSHIIVGSRSQVSPIEDRMLKPDFFLPAPAHSTPRLNSTEPISGVSLSPMGALASLSSHQISQHVCHPSGVRTIQVFASIDQRKTREWSQPGSSRKFTTDALRGALPLADCVNWRSFLFRSSSTAAQAARHPTSEYHHE